MMDGELITPLRTAAASAVAVKVNHITAYGHLLCCIISTCPTILLVCSPLLELVYKLVAMLECSSMLEIFKRHDEFFKNLVISP